MKFEPFVRECLQSALEELLGDMPEQPTDGDVEALRIVAVVGFAGDDVRGTLGVAANSLGLARIASHFGQDPEAAAAEGAMGEFANQILGNVKRNFDRRALPVQLATPQLLRGLSIQLCGRATGTWTEHDVRSGPMRITTWVDAEARPDLEIPSEVVDNSVADQGDALFF